MPEVPETDWKRFFDAHAPRYMENVFTRHTKAEIDFLLGLFPLARGARVLDMGCGTGRHSVELASRGFTVTGVDLSTGMLEQARKAAQAANVSVEFIEEDATKWRSSEPFDAAICLCEGAFGLINAKEEPEEHDRAILSNISSSLKPNGPFLLTGLNGYSVIRRMTDELVQQGQFDPATMVADYYDEWDLPEGTMPIRVRERLFVPPEIVRMLVEAGFDVDHVYGGTAGAWGRRPLSLDEIEAMFVCRRKP
jgi:2-polyprenyl-3-methyl-5-hydroxy-6-metoxy-1,4-benzoquinol methylase